MDRATLLPALVGGLALGIAIALWLLAWRRRLPADITGQVKRDISLAMLRALLLLLAGLTLWFGLAVGWLPRADPARWVASALIVIGGVGFLARVALYRLRIKPDLDRLSVPVAPASPVFGIRGDGEEDG